MSDPLQQQIAWLAVARQNKLITDDQILDAARQWAGDKTVAIPQVLRQNGVLQPAAIDVVTAIIDLRQNDEEEDVSWWDDVDDVATILKQVDDPDVQATLATEFFPAVSTADAAKVEPTTPPNVSQRFEVVSPHASGGLGAVFVAVDRELNRKVALKEILPRHQGNDAVRHRFVREALITGSLEHPSVVPVYSLGVHADGRPFYAMRFVEGKTLEEVATEYHQKRNEDGGGENSLELRRLLSHFMAICSAMQFAHERGVIHRDLKPNNVLVGPFGQTFVVDWGLAKDIRSTESVEFALDSPTAEGCANFATVAGQQMGTPAYMSPEQAAGDQDAMGPASDIFSLGSILYYLLTGHSAFTATSLPEMLAKVQRGVFNPPREVDGRVPRALEAICLKAMAVRPEDRYASAQALRDDVERWMADQPVSAYSEPLSQRLDRFLAKSRISAEFGEWGPLLLGCAVVILVSHVVLFWLSWDGPPYRWNWIVRLLQLGSVVGLLWWYRSFKLRPTTDGERFICIIWMSHVVAWVLIQHAARRLFPGGAWDELNLFPIWCVLAGLGFIAMGALFWGRFLLFGIGFLVLSAVVPYCMRWSPLAFGLMVAAALLAIRSHLQSHYRQ